MRSECGDLAAYIAGELTEEEMKRFECHLSGCNTCSSELKELQEAWSFLPFDADKTDVPSELKTEVMDYVFNHKKTNIQQKGWVSALLQRTKHWSRRRVTSFSIVAIAILFVVLVGVVYQNVQLNKALIQNEHNTNSTTRIVQTYTLKSVHSDSKAHGYANVLKTKSGHELVIRLDQMTTTKDGQVYQVWLLDDDTRENAGTFRPAPNGNGMMTYSLSNDVSFDQIGITLEPDAHGTKPRGMKVVGTQ